MRPILLRKNMIKPSSPTPEHLRTYKLSYLDYISPPVYARYIFFFRKSSPDRNPKSIADLRKSLSKVLTHYYPFAGRIKDKSSIVCNDEGVEFHEARIAINLSDTLQQPNLEKISHFFVSSRDFDPKLCPVVIQATRLDCGSIAISFLVLFKLGDYHSVSSFIKDWASITLDPCQYPSPQFNGASIAPLSMKVMLPLPYPEKESYTMKRLVFEASKIDALKSGAQKGAGSASVEPSDSLEATVIALVSRCVAAALKSSGSRKKCMLNCLMDLRTTAMPPLPENSVGNFLLANTFSVNGDEMDLQNIVEKLKAGKEENCATYGKRSSEDEWSLEIRNHLLKLMKKYVFKPFEMFYFNNLQQLPFYEVDFGWGKPVWFGFLPDDNSISLQKTGRGDDGIEVLIGLDSKVMAFFEHNAEILPFFSPNLSSLLGE